MKPSADINHPQFYECRNAFFCYNSRRKRDGKPTVSFDRYLKARGKYGKPPKVKKPERQEPKPGKPGRKPRNNEPVYLAHKHAFQGFNAARKRKGLLVLTFDQYLRHISTVRVEPKKADDDKPKERKDLKIKWQAENLRRQKRSLLPLKYADLVRDWGDWV